MVFSYLYSKSTPEGETYITMIQSEYERECDPFEVENNLLLSVLELDFYNNNKMIEYKNLDFCNQYGMFRFGQAVIEQDFDRGIIKLQKNNVWDKNALTEQEFMAMIYPFDEYSHRVVKGKEMSITLCWKASCEENHFQPWVLFDHRYAESITWMADYIKSIYGYYQKFQHNELIDFPISNVKPYVAFNNAKQM